MIITVWFYIEELATPAMWHMKKILPQWPSSPFSRRHSPSSFPTCRFPAHLPPWCGDLSLPAWPISIHEIRYVQTSFSWRGHSLHIIHLFQHPTEVWSSLSSLWVWLITLDISLRLPCDSQRRHCLDILRLRLAIANVCSSVALPVPAWRSWAHFPPRSRDFSLPAWSLVNHEIWPLNLFQLMRSFIAQIAPVPNGGLSLSLHTRPHLTVLRYGVCIHFWCACGVSLISLHMCQASVWLPLFELGPASMNAK